MYNGVYDIEQFAYLYPVLMKWVELKIRGNTLGERLSEMGIGEISIYGMSEFGRLVYEDIVDSAVVVKCFIDRKADDFSYGCEGIPVLRPDALPDSIKAGFILITPEIYFLEIYEALLEQGIPHEKIISVPMLV